MKEGLNRRSISDCSIFDNHHYSIANVEIKLRPISLVDMILIDNCDIATDSDIFIKNGPPHRCSLAHPNWRSSSLSKHLTLLGGFKVISSHHESVLKYHVVLHTGTDTQYTVVNAAGL